MTSFTVTTRKTLRSIEPVRPLYILPGDPLAEEVLIPAFRVATAVDCMVGFFSSAVLASLAPGLATYISEKQNSLRLIISPLLRAEDLAAIEDGARSTEDVLSERLEEIVVNADLLQQHTLKCFSWLLRTQRIEIRVALMKDALFHPKVWLFSDNSDTVAVHGSSNVTYAGIRKNIEQVAISKSWEDASQHYITDKLLRQFSRFWDNKTDDCLIVPLPHAVRDKLLRVYDTAAQPTESDLRALFERASAPPKHVAEPISRVKQKRPPLSIPPELRYEDGPFQHQGRAVSAWCNAGYSGILEMATGSGKTITAMIAASRLFETVKPLMVVVAAPYLPLIDQWCDEIGAFSLDPVNLAQASGPGDRARELQKLTRRLRNGISNVETIVVSHDTLCTSAFQAELGNFGGARLLIADEVHNLGREAFVSSPPEFFDYRLGLSATPVRQYDEEGTQALIDFFGSVVYRFTLEDAIGVCLVEYDYYVHPVFLTEAEMGNWYDLTARIRATAWQTKDGGPDDYLAKLLRDRRGLLETAAGKVSTMQQLLAREDTRNLRHTLIYTSDKGPEQLANVNELLRSSHVLFHQLTAEETASRDETRRIIEAFQAGEIQALTAKRVLDEGVNIPQICKAFILASTTVERQWIQRRGRLLRTCAAIGKTHSVIHDLVALPPGIDDGLDSEARMLVRSELGRVQEFARLARNAGRPDGPLATIDRMVRAAYLS